MRAPPRLATIAALTLAGCASQSPPAPAPTRAPPPVIAARPAAPTGSDWRDWPVTPGTWSYRRDARGSIALFGQPGADALVTLRCDASMRRIYLSRAGTNAAPVTIRTSSTVRTLPLEPTGGTPPYVALALVGKDPLLDAIGFSRGHFTLEQPATPPLVVPAWAEIERVVEDCRG